MRKSRHRGKWGISSEVISMLINHEDRQRSRWNASACHGQSSIYQVIITEVWNSKRFVWRRASYVDRLKKTIHLTSRKYVVQSMGSWIIYCDWNVIWMCPTITFQLSRDSSSAIINYFMVRNLCSPFLISWNSYDINDWWLCRCLISFTAPCLAFINDDTIAARRVVLNEPN